MAFMIRCIMISSATVTVVAIVRCLSLAVAMDPLRCTESECEACSAMSVRVSWLAGCATEGGLGSRGGERDIEALAAGQREELKRRGERSFKFKCPMYVKMRGTSGDKLRKEGGPREGIGARWLQPSILQLIVVSVAGGVSLSDVASPRSAAYASSFGSAPNAPHRASAISDSPSALPDR